MVAIVPTRQDFRRVCLALYCVLSAFLFRTYYGLLALAFWGKRQPFSRGTIGLRWASHYPAGVCSLSHVHCARLTFAKFRCGALSCFAPLEAFAAMWTTSLTNPPGPHGGTAPVALEGGLQAAASLVYCFTPPSPAQGGCFPVNWLVPVVSWFLPLT